MFHNNKVKRISVIIPNRNGGKTIGRCLAALYSSHYGNFEVIVVDDCSSDDSVEVIQSFPCRLVRLDSHSGASAARNTGARLAGGDLLFFIDADCIVHADTLFRVNSAAEGKSEIFCGGTYTRLPYDDSFFSTFQSVFIHYSETKRGEPDYIASHAMVIDRETFRRSGGFPEDFMPIIEDVEFSHRLRRGGKELTMDPSILVSHIFGFTFVKSLRNAFRKSRYWTAYSLKNGDLFQDSGTASVELKTNVASLFFAALLGLLSFASGRASFFIPVPAILALNVYVNRNLFSAFGETKGPAFALAAALYYLMVYPLAVAAGSLTGAAGYYFSSRSGAA